MCDDRPGRGLLWYVTPFSLAALELQGFLGRGFQSRVDKMQLVPTARLSAGLRLTRSWFAGQPLQVGWFCPPELIRVVERCSDSFDLLHVQLSRLGPVGVGLNIPKVLDMVDALSLNLTRRAHKERWPLTNLWALEAKRMRIYETSLVHIYDRVTVVSAKDREAIGSHEKICVVPNGVDLTVHQYVGRDARAATIIFTGRMRYFPNQEAAIYLVKRVLPLVRTKVPGARVMLVGADPPPSVMRLGREPGVLVTGWVPTLREYFARATVAAAPLLSGSGMQNKVLEAMACGVPVVATPYAVDGIDGEPGEHFLVGRNEHELANCIVRIIQDREYGDYVARNARRLVENKYTWERSVCLLEKAYIAARAGHEIMPMKIPYAGNK